MRRAWKRLKSHDKEVCRIHLAASACCVSAVEGAAKEIQLPAGPGGAAREGAVGSPRELVDWRCMNIYDTLEGARLVMNRQNRGHWNRWGPFLSERAWGTVREDYSSDREAWDYFPHDHARSRAYRWNEDGIAGICDRHQYLCFALALWNGHDPFLKERMFGLSGPEGNHGEDVKEYYFYLDNTPTHSYMKYLYKHPESAYPYEQLSDESRRRTKEDPEYELVDTGVFDQHRYFDVVVEYAKAGAEDLLIRITITNQGPEPASLRVLPTLWFRNTWS